MRRIILLIVIILSVLPSSLMAGVVLKGVYTPDMIAVGEKYIYVAEGWEIKFFSRGNFMFIKSIGRQGEGPGEFKGFIIPHLVNDILFVNCPTKVLYFDLEGKFLRERRALKVFGRYKPVGDNFVGYRYLRENNIRYEAVFLFDSDFESVRELYRRKYIRQDDGSTDLINERPPFFYIEKNRIYLDGIDGRIYVFDNRGGQIESIPVTDEKIPLTRQHIRKMEDELKRDKRTREYYYRNKDKFLWPDYQPMIQMFYLADNCFYILTSKEREGKREMLAVNKKGELLAKKYVDITSFPAALLAGVLKGKLYQLIENDAGDWEVQVTQILDSALLK